MKKDIPIIVAHESDTIRYEVTAALRDLGCSQVTSARSLREVRQFIHRENGGWVIASTFATHSQTSLSLLRTLKKSRRTNGAKFSLLVDDRDHHDVLDAFRCDLLSYHRKPFTKGNLRESLATVFSRFWDNDESYELTAGQFQFDFHMESDRYDRAEVLNLRLLERYPETINLWLNLMRSQLARGDQAAATLSLDRANLQGEGLHLAQKLFEEHGLETDQKTLAERLGVRRCLIVDPDARSAEALSSACSTIGFSEVKICRNGQEAWGWLEQHQEPDLIIQEWRLQGINGFALLQRIRNRGFHQATVMVTSDVLQPDDIPLLHEMSVADVLRKPVKRDQLTTHIGQVLHQESYPSDQKAMERKIIKQINSGSFDSIKPLIKKYLRDERVPLGKRRFVHAKVAFAQADYQSAKDLAVDSIKLLGRESLSNVSLLGHCLLKLGDHQAAQQFLNKAQRLSPKNISRVCELAEVNVMLGKTEEAASSLESAMILDADAPQVVATDAKIALVSGDVAKARHLMGGLDNLSEVVAFMNNQAVSHIRSGGFERGIELYHQTLEALSGTNRELEAIVHYNLGLAHVRNRSLDPAIDHLTQACSQGPSRIYAKSRSLLARAQQANVSQRNLQLRTRAPRPQTSKGGLTSDDLAALQRIHRQQTSAL